MNSNLDVDICSKSVNTITSKFCEMDTESKVSYIFDTKLIELYKKLENKDKYWSENVRDFIIQEMEIIGLDEFDTIGDVDLTEDEKNDVKQIGFYLFVGEKCADIDEDEFDGPNDLFMHEWEDLEDIILYYYNHKKQFESR